MKDRKISSEKLNFIVAVCAILISAASFYATYLQADAANKQVKAMTMPLLQFGSGNWDETDKENQLTFSLNNAGAGAALIKNVAFYYKNTKYLSLEKFMEACCDPEYSQFLDKMRNRSDKTDSFSEKGGFPMTRPIDNSVLVGGGKNEFFQMVLSQQNEKFWRKLNKERFHLKIKVCFCSLLDDCYITKENGVATPVDQCL
ncbi:MAG: hypothetical protein COB35_02935 [Gammaproteobacteria bacterium]|nr:MAG: hypothetical protein COB35_02935 [Gammaproteobacteria bacterium]